jgi:hypothetical protein
MESEGEHKTIDFMKLSPLSLKIGIKLGWSWNTMKRDMERFCSEEVGELIERLVVDELSEPMLDLCDDIEQNVPMAGRL